MIHFESPYLLYGVISQRCNIYGIDLQDFKYLIPDDSPITITPYLGVDIDQLIGVYIGPPKDFPKTGVSKSVKEAFETICIPTISGVQFEPCALFPRIHIVS